MNIYVDESGSFPTTTIPNSWCVIAAYASPEGDRKALKKLMSSIRVNAGGAREVKLSSLPEFEYFQFLSELNKRNGVVFAAATEMSLNDKDVVAHHQLMQAAKVVQHRSKMIHLEAQKGLTDLSVAVQALPPNLYAQLMFQVTLFHNVVTQSIPYFCQRYPQTLGNFRWRVDRKDVIPTAYEKTFRMILPALLQTISMREPITMVRGFDYSYMAKYEFARGDGPTYLQTQYNLPEVEGFNLGMMVGENFEFVDSKASDGVQVVDLLASGFRRLLKGDFADNETAAMLLGGLTVQAEKGKFPLKLVALSNEAYIGGKHARHLKILESHARPMLLKH